MILLSLFFFFLECVYFIVYVLCLAFSSPFSFVRRIHCIFPVSFKIQRLVLILFFFKTNKWIFSQLLVIQQFRFPEIKIKKKKGKLLFILHHSSFISYEEFFFFLFHFHCEACQLIFHLLLQSYRFSIPFSIVYSSTNTHLTYSRRNKGYNLLEKDSNSFS